jgi:hypothetical protein
MADTTNPTVTTTWSKLVATGDDFLLTLPFFGSATTVEVATTTADSAPTGIVGHIISGEHQEGINRVLIGPGYVWAKAKGNVPVVLNTWTP